MIRNSSNDYITNSKAMMTKIETRFKQILDKRGHDYNNDRVIATVAERI